MVELRPGLVCGLWYERPGRWGLAQICRLVERDGHPGFEYLVLDYFEPELPRTPDGLRPLVNSAYRTEGELGHDQFFGPAPAEWVEVGTAPVLCSGGAVTTTLTPGMQEAFWMWKWRQLAPEVRTALKEAYRPGRTVVIGGEEVSAGMGELRGSLLQAPLAELAQLVAISTVRLDVPVADPSALLAGFPVLGRVFVATDLEGVELALPSGVEFCDLLERQRQPVVVRGGHTDLAVRVIRAEDLAASPEVRDLRIWKAPEVDLATVVDRCPALEQLAIAGEPSMVRGLDALGRLPRLRQLFMTDAFGYDAIPPGLPLSRLFLKSVPAHAAAQARADYADVVEIKQPRSAAWITANLENPFRSWIDNEHVPASAAKKAAAAYKRRRKALLVAAEQAARGDLSQSALEELMTTEFTQAAAEFNTWDRRTHWIETIQREFICQVYFELAEEASAVHPCNATAAMEALHQRRDW